jgi:hypothetical protein
MCYPLAEQITERSAEGRLSSYSWRQGLFFGNAGRRFVSAWFDRPICGVPDPGSAWLPGGCSIT